MSDDKDPGFISFSKFLRDDNADRVAHGQEIPAENINMEDVFADKESVIFSGMFYAMLDTIPKSSITAFYEPISLSKLNITIKEAEHYRDMLMDSEYFGARTLFYVACAIFLNILQHLKCTLSYDHIDINSTGKGPMFHINDTLMNTRPEPGEYWQSSLFSAVIGCYFTGRINSDNDGGYLQAIEYGSTGIKEEDATFIGTFIRISLVLLTTSSAYMRILDNARYTKWLETCGIKEDTSLDKAIESAGEFFSGE